jgi:hypothetical protein
MNLKCLPVLFALAMTGTGFAQSGAGAGSAGGSREPTEDLRTRNAMSQAELKRLSEQIDQWSRADGRNITPRAARARAAAMMEVLEVSCVLSDAAYRGTTPGIATQHLYEAACEEGTGFLLALQGTSLTGVSCLAPGPDDTAPKCALPANADPKQMATTILGRHRIACQARDLRWLGASAAHIDHFEVACEQGGGHVIRAPVPGTVGTLAVISCQDASQQGIACALSSPTASPPAAPDARPTLSWFQEALVRNGVTCQTKRARIVGRESVKRRYVVEFECADRPEGLVAFVPASGDTVNAFESASCQEAAARGVTCAW